MGNEKRVAMTEDRDDSRRYDDIIDLPHHVSQTHPRMSMLNRAAQFAPFAALTGYGAAIDEAARLTQRRVELSEAEQEALNEKLSALAKRVRHALATAGIPFDRKRFNPHITLLRRASVGKMPPACAAPASMTVNGFSLMRSERGGEGMIYTELGRAMSSS